MGGVKKFKGGGQNFGVKLFDLYEAYMPNIGFLLSLELFKKFVVGWVDGLSQAE